MIATEYQPMPFEVTETTTKENRRVSDKVNAHGGWDYELVDITIYTVPCGREYKTPFSDRSDAERHMNSCRTCKIIGGRSRAKVLNQNEVCLVWAKTNYQAHTPKRNGYSANVRAEGDRVMHYSTISFLRTDSGEIIQNREDWSQGWAYVPTIPQNLNLVKANLPLTTLGGIRLGINRYSIKILESGNLFRDEVLFTAKRNNSDELCYFLFGWDDQFYLVELFDEPQTIKEAFESMKPELVKAFNNSMSPVQRQGDLFLVPVGLKDEDFEEIDKAHYVHDGYRKELYKPQILINPHMAIPWGQSEETLVFDETRHYSRRLAMKDNICYVKGKVTHSQHRSIELDTWHMVVQNRTKGNYSLGGGVD